MINKLYQDEEVLDLIKESFPDKNASQIESIKLMMNSFINKSLNNLYVNNLLLTILVIIYINLKL